MKNKNLPAFPIVPYREFLDDIERGYPFGLTKREYFAGLAMQGILASNPEVEYGDHGRKMPMPMNDIALLSVQAADALITSLNKP